MNSTRLNIQRVVGRLLVFPIGFPMFFLLKNRANFKIKNLQEVRKKFRKLSKENTPLLVCANHLTLIDSLIIHLAFGSSFWYLLNYKYFLWNVPAVENANKKLLWRFLTFIGKCIKIDREGDSDHTGKILDQIKYCLQQGELVLIFPEGTRSRTARVVPENVTYGVGKILSSMPECKVLCVYLRGEGQDAYSDFPKNGEKFDLELEVISTKTEAKGLRAARDISMQVINKLKEMEDSHFARLI